VDCCLVLTDSYPQIDENISHDSKLMLWGSQVQKSQCFFATFSNKASRAHTLNGNLGDMYVN